MSRGKFSRESTIELDVEIFIDWGYDDGGGHSPPELVVDDVLVYMDSERIETDGKSVTETLPVSIVRAIEYEIEETIERIDTGE